MFEYFFAILFAIILLYNVFVKARLQNYKSNTKRRYRRTSGSNIHNTFDSNYHNESLPASHSCHHSNSNDLPVENYHHNVHHDHTPVNDYTDYSSNTSDSGFINDSISDYSGSNFGGNDYSSNDSTNVN